MRRFKAPASNSKCGPFRRTNLAVTWPLCRRRSGIGNATLEDGSAVKCFICEQYAIAGAEEITHFGGWRKYLARPA